MKFGDTPLSNADGAVLAHSVRTKGIAFKKGRRLTADDVAALGNAGITSVIAARLDPDDVSEDDAATRIAAALQGDHLTASAAFTGRVNLIATHRGLAVIDDVINALNRIDEAITVATVPAWDLVAPRQIVATIKIIPFAVAEPFVMQCETLARQVQQAVRVAPLLAKSIGLVQTQLPGTKASVLDKTIAVLSARLERLDSTLANELRCDHDATPLQTAIETHLSNGCDMVLVAGASAITDRRDVIPSAIEGAGGAIEHFGMPVDPGNLLMLGRIGDTPVVGLPGCARSPKFNGIDWVLQRLCADVPLAPEDIMAMGIGGLLKEMPGRPQPRTGETSDQTAPRAPRIASIILAAGQSRRMGDTNKLLATVDGKPMVRWAVEAALASAATPVYVVLGHQADVIRDALMGVDVTFVDNPEFADGISASVRRGVAALPPDVDGAVVILGDMPKVGNALIDRLVSAYNPVEGRALCIPTWRGKRGNPVLIGKQFFAEVQDLSGDVGARPLISQYPELICEVEMDDDAALVDIDTPEALGALGD